jgi:hypothetical protein
MPVITVSTDLETKIMAFYYPRFSACSPVGPLFKKAYFPPKSRRLREDSLCNKVNE